MLFIDEERCKGCSLCVHACPRNILVLSTKFNKAGHHPVTAGKPGECTSCLACARMCPDLAITITKGEDTPCLKQPN